MEAHYDVTPIAIVAVFAMVFGLLLVRARQPAIVGYILAGVILGPSGLGLVQDRAAVGLLAELGIIMLLFVVGLELSVRRFAEVWRIAVITTLLQVAGSVSLMWLMHLLLDWGLGMSIVLGYAVALSSTAVVIKLLEQLGELQGKAGRLTVGILIAQDMAVVPMLLSLRAVAGAAEGFPPADIAKLVASVLFLAVLVFVLLRREIKIPFAAFVSQHGDLAPLAAFAYCFGAAALSGLAGLSPAYGAFLCGLVLGNSANGGRFVHHAHPLQSILLMVFFLSIGLLLDLDFLWDNIGAVLLMLLAVTVFKTALNIGALRLQGVPWAEATLAGVALAQIGEFSFLLTGAGVDLKLLTQEEGQLVVAVTVLSLAISPLWLLTGRRLASAGQAGLSTAGALLDAVYRPEAERLHRVRRILRVSRRYVSRRLPMVRPPPRGPVPPPRKEAGDA